MTRGNHRRIRRIYRADDAEETWLLLRRSLIVKSQAQVELANGVPFIPDADLKKALDEAGVRSAATDAALGLQRCPHRRARSALAILALLAIAALFLAQRIPTQQPGKAAPT